MTIYKILLLVAFTLNPVFANVLEIPVWDARVSYVENDDLSASLYYNINSKEVLVSKKEDYFLEKVAFFSSDESALVLLAIWRDQGRGRYIKTEFFSLTKKAPYFEKTVSPKVLEEPMSYASFNFDEKAKKLSISYSINNFIQNPNGPRKKLVLTCSEGKIILSSNSIDSPKSHLDFLNLGEYFRLNREYDKSISYFVKGTSKVKQSKIKIPIVLLASANFHLAQSYIGTGENEKARKLLKDIAEYFKKMKIGQDAKKLLRSL